MNEGIEISQPSTQIINDGEYLKLADDLKKQFEEVEEERNRLKKEVLTIYGVIRLIDSMEEVELISTLRGHLSELYDEFYVK